MQCEKKKCLAGLLIYLLQYINKLIQVNYLKTKIKFINRIEMCGKKLKQSTFFSGANARWLEYRTEWLVFLRPAFSFGEEVTSTENVLHIAGQ